MPDEVWAITLHKDREDAAGDLIVEIENMQVVPSADEASQRARLSRPRVSQDQNLYEGRAARRFQFGHRVRSRSV